MRGFRLHIILTVCLAALMLSCEEKILPEDQNMIIVEGWIDAGGYPVVIVTRSLPVRLRDDAIELDNGEMTIDEQREWLLDIFKERTK